MRRLATLVLVACSASSHSDPPIGPVARPSAGSATPGDASPMPTYDAAMATGEPIVLDLVEGTPSALPDGTQVSVKGVMYAHLADSKNLSSVNLIVTRGAQTLQIALAREHGGSASNQNATESALGWQFTLEMADPYQQPSRARVEARKFP